MIRVLFVCLGNICRSPMAEAIFKHLVIDQGLEGKIDVDSAGIGHWHIGSQPHEGTRKLLNHHKITCEGISARQIQESDWDDFDYIIAMDDKNISDLKAIREKNDVVIDKLLNYIPEGKIKDIPDPYFTGDFDYVYELIADGCKQLLEKVTTDHDLKEE